MTMERIGRYEVVKELGAGAMAVVYKAIDPIIGRTVAIKTIKLDSSIGLEHDELRQRFYREAQNAGNLNHPNIVTIYDIGTADNVDYIAMEFVEGESLQDWMARNRMPSVEQTIALMEQIASGLAYAAAHDIIHRDIKPANILLTQDMTAKIADFGIAKISTSKLTQTGAVIGTPSYMSPEQAMGKTLDGRSDIFSLGVIFYEMLTGEKPFSGTNPSTIIYKILHETPVQPQQLNVTLHPAFNEIIARMLAKDPDQRYQSCTHLIQDLKNYASLETQTPPPAAAPTAATSVQAGKGGGRAAVFAFLLVAVIAVAGYWYYQASQPSPAPESAVMESPPQAPASATLPAAPAAESKAVPDKAPEKVDRQVPPAKKESLPAPTAEPSGRAEVRLEFAGERYPVTVLDGGSTLQELSASNPSMPIAIGSHHFRLVSGDVFLDAKLDPVRLKADQVYAIPVPALCSAFIEVPNDAYDGCEIHLDGKLLPAPYPAQIPKLAAGQHRIVFRWDSGKYAGKEISASFAGETNRHYRVRGEPANEKVIIQQLR